MKEILEIILLVVGIVCLASCLVNSILLTIDTSRTIKRCKELDKEIQEKLKEMSEDCKKLSENTIK